MKIIISPAKKMQVQNDWMVHKQLPVFLDKTEILMNLLKEKTPEELQKLWMCNDRIAQVNLKRLKSMDLRQQLTPALLAYDGIQYTYMAPKIFTDSQWDYVNSHLYILSGFYGILGPLDGVVPYRLEMQARLKTESFKNLYEFWKDEPYKKLVLTDDLILNLASKEYSKLVEKYLDPETAFVTCIFGEWVEGKVKVKGTLAKMARGEMVRYLSLNRIETLDGIKGFSGLGFKYYKALSDEKNFVFLRNS